MAKGTGRLRNLVNWTSIAGGAILGASATILFSVAVADFLSTAELAYVGVIYLFAGLGVAGGAAVVGLGALRSWIQRRRGIAAKPLSLVIDLNAPRQRNIALLSSSVALLVLIGVFAGTYQSVVYLESDAFCVGACHSVMAPEGQTHVTSPHSRVKCASCHVGSGAGSFFEAKLNGMNQLWAVVTGDFERPISTPIHNMQPARVTCEQCHWRDRWIGFKEKVSKFYGSDDDNPISELRMLVKIGGSQSGIIKGEGIHYHMTIGRKVEFIARDHAKQDIAWIRVTNQDGEVTEYNHDFKPLKPDERASLPVHQMDCMDCHNRPAHQFGAPMRLVNQAMVDQRIDPSIPGIKRLGVQALAGEYETTQAAMSGIESKILDHYRAEKPDYFEDHSDAVQQAATELKQIFTASQFPEMKARWSAYPDNLGHRDWPGCFRCHNEDMITGDGEAIFSTCNGCHIVLAQTEDNGGGVNFVEGQAFYHVADEETLEEFTDCTECHDGADGPY